MKNTAPEKPVRMNGRGKTFAITLENFFTKQQGGTAYIIDARPGWLFALGHIPGAVSIPAKINLDANLEKHEAGLAAAVNSGKTIVVYCSGLLCADARTVSSHLAAAGFSSAIYHGGWDGWKNAGMPVD
ncbi:MAG: rhodanese-like domain-containing protein [Verrucomicrobiota bacterium]